MGYIRAGFAVTGVDIEPQRNYPGTFVLGDALDYLAAHGHEYDLVHASPPCQGYSTGVRSRSSQWTLTLGKDEPRLIAATRALLIASGRPWIMENVTGARQDLRASVLLCGTMFGRPIARHRLFEASHWIAQPEHPRCIGVGKQFAAARGWEYRDMSVTGKGRRKGTTQRWKEIMGMDWELTQHQLVEAIPPVYTEYLGGEMLRQLAAA